MSFYMGARKVLAGFIRFIFRAKIKGMGNEPPFGGCVVCANHTSMLDVFILSACLERQLRYLAKAELFKIPILSGLIRSLGAYSVDRGKSDVGAIKKTLSLLKNGEMVCIFPQGTRHEGINPADTKIKSGVGMAAYHARVPVLPVYIKLKNYKYALFRKTEVIIGEPIKYEDLGFSGGGSAEYSAASKIIFDRICSLSGE